MTSVTDLLSRIKVHDVDTHVSEPPDLWTSRMSAKWGDDRPHIAPDPETGLDRWYLGKMAGPRTIANLNPTNQTGGWDPKARLAWMDEHGVYSQVLYPNLLGFFPRAFMSGDPKWSLECVRAYNDFQTEFCSVAPNRLIPMTNLPWWDIDASVAELERCHAAGHKGINWGFEFEKVGFPRLRDEHWDPVLSRVQEIGWPVNFHIGFNSEDVDLGTVMAMTKLDQSTWAAKFFTGNIHCISELIMGRICHRFPTLKFVSVESGVGFLPYLIEALDWQFLNNNLHKDYPDMLLPSEYFRRQIYGTFWFETDVTRLADLYPDNFMFESDFPHSTSLTPAESNPYVKGPRDTIIANLATIPEPLLVKLLQDNAAAVYNLS